MASNPGYKTMELSRLDQIAPRAYTRILLCFPLTSNPDSTIEAIQKGVDITVTQLPFLVGTLSLKKDGGEKNGKLEISYPSNANQLQVKHVFMPEISYEELSRLRMPVSKLDNSFAPVP